MSSRSGARRAVAAIAGLVTAVGLGLAGAGAASADGLTPYPGSVPGWATSAADQGAAPADETQEGELYLTLRDQAGAERIATQVSTPGSPLYKRSLAPATWIERYAPTQKRVDRVVAYLRSKGLTITTVPKSRLFIVYRGTAQQIGDAFATSIHRYRHAGRTVTAPSRAPSLPAALAGDVTAIGADQARLLTHPDSVTQDADARTSSPLQRRAAADPVLETPCSHYLGETTVTVPPAYDGNTRYSTNLCGYTPAQLRSAYGVQDLVARGNDGRGQTIAITDAYASPSIVADVDAYSAQNHEPALADGQYSQIVPDPSAFLDQEACGYPSGWQGEQTLDVEAVHALAPGARILYVGGFNCAGGLDAAVSRILDDRLADKVSNSWGNIGEDLPPDVLSGENRLFLQAAAEGIGMYFSSGDNGDETQRDDGLSLPSPQPDFPASSPWVTSVGGTSLGIDASGRRAFEVGWGDRFDQIVKGADGALAYAEGLPGSRFVGGAGGGTSTVFAQPDYQRGVVPAGLAKGKRVSPDIAALADPYTGFQIGISPIVDDTKLTTGPYINETYGGTSLASPLTAAQVALVQQATRSSVGFANPTLYAVDRYVPRLFRDVVPQDPPQGLIYTSARSGNTYFVTLDRDTSLATARGYDPVTGIGGISFTLLSYVAERR